MTATTRVEATAGVFDCETCANTVERVLLKTAGVADVSLDAASRTLVVRHDPTAVDGERVEGIVDEWGYAAGTTGRSPGGESGREGD